jgi:hypothetical protein
MSGLPNNPQTDANGNYSDQVISGWSGTVIPSKANYTFNPISRPYNNVTSNQTNQDYIATYNPYYYTISGQVTYNGSGLSGVIMSGLPNYPQTDANGNYSDQVISGWSGTVIPSKTNYTFYPTSRPYNNVTSNQTNQDYTATYNPPQCTISGQVIYNGSGLSDVVMNGLPNSPQTDANGNYSDQVNSGWSITVKPTKANYAFYPISRTYIHVTSDKTNQDYTATYNPPTPTPPTPTPITSPYLTGKVVDTQSGKPVNAAWVQIDGGALRVFSNAIGVFYMYGVSPGNHKLQIWGWAYEFKEQDINFPSNGALDIGTISLSKIGGTVVGRLVDSQTGDPLAAATVQLDGGGQWRTLTDEQGNFMLIFVTPGQHQLQSWGYAYTFQEMTIDVNSTCPMDLGSLAFSIIPDTARGQVVDKNTGRPIMNAHVQFDGGGVARETETNRSGRFTLINVPAGNRQLQTWGWAYSFDQRGFIQTAGAATDIGQVQIEPIGSMVNGRLLDAVNGLPIYNATVQLDGGNYVPWKTLSLLNGDFIVYDVSGGTHQFQTWGYAYRFLQQEISCVAGQNKGMGNITLTPDPNTFNGRALDAQTRLPIQGAEVVCTGGGQYITSESFPDGRFVLLNVPQGVYDITVDAPNHSLVYFKVAHPGEDKNVELGDVLMP